MKNNNKIALITGASSGIGETFARKLAQQGYDLILVARRRVKLREIAAQLEEKHSINTEILVADLSSDQGIDFVDARIRNCSNLMILVNGAGFGTLGDFKDVDLKDSMDMNTVHVTAPVQLCHAALSVMIENKRGYIINVSSISGFLAGKGCVTYCASKAYINSFSESLSAEVAPYGIHVQALCPGLTYTEFHDNPRLEGFSRSEVPGWMWMKADKVVDASLKALNKNKLYVIPGLKYKILTALLRNQIIGPILIRFMKRI